VFNEFRLINSTYNARTLIWMAIIFFPIIAVITNFDTVLPRFKRADKYTDIEQMGKIA
jgi:hypothetical protein